MHKREARWGRAAGGMRATAAAVVLAAAVAACGGGERPAPEKPRSSGPDAKTVALIERTNKAMAGTSFAASGTNSAFGGAEQDITWDPEHGFHMAVRADDGTEADMFCREGRSYISAPLLAETLNRRGQRVELPGSVADKYVTVQAESCDAYFAVPTDAERAPDRDTTIRGEESEAVVVDRTKGADVYHLAATGDPRLLKWDARRDGMETTMTYRGYGAGYTVDLPSEGQQIKMTEFQAALTGAGS